ncbi:MAG: TonB-dependent receptor [Alphaproteobacteria bacterium]|nr:TonB-dependent receptor [Alphaproteobacteria bacterium]
MTAIRAVSVAAVVVTTEPRGFHVHQELNSRALRRTLLLGAASAAAICLSGTAFAQSSSSNVETVVVTGSRIPTTNLTTTSPVTELTSQDIKSTGVTRVEDLVTQLPQAFASQNSTVSNGATGTATISLRNLGASRTLVLIDGLRMPYGSPTDPAADLNEIPTQMVQRVEVLTGGASATYGSDAVAGVVNFIMKKDFQGFQIDAEYSIYQHDNGDNQGGLRNDIASLHGTNPSQFKLPPSSVMVGRGLNLSAMLGVSSPNGKGNVTAYFSYRNDQPILESHYDYSACAATAISKSNTFLCGGSSTSYPGRFSNFSTFDYTLGKTPGTFVPWSPANQYNYGPLNYFQRPDTRYSFGAFSHYKVNDHVEVYSQLMFTNYETLAQIAPSGDFFRTNTINCGNPLLSSSQLTDIGCTAADIAANSNVGMYIGRRNVEGGPRIDDLQYTSYRAILGFRGEITKGWNYDVSGQYAKVLLSEHYLNEFSVKRLNNALDVVTNPANGQPVCASVLNGTDTSCVPYDIFTGAGPSKAALSYLNVPLLQQGATDLQDLIAQVTGDLGQYGIKSPWAEGSAKVAMGIEYRANGLNLLPDLEYQTFDGAGQGGPVLPVSGNTSVSEGFAEFMMPVVENKPLAQLISVDLAYRYSSYNTSVTTNTWKIGGDWAPDDSVRFRGSYDHAVRAPNVLDLYTAQGFNLFNAPGDPCGPATTGVYQASLAQCEATGVPLAQYQSAALTSPAGQYNFLQGGNPDLRPETANTWTLGAVLTPTAIPGFSGSIDYWNISIKNLISTVGATNTLAACYQYNVAASCALIHRNGLGQLWVGSGYVSDLNTNVGSLKENGVDFSAFYQLDLADVGAAGDGQVTFGFTGTWVNELVTNPGVPGLPAYDCNGKYGNACGTPNPSWRHRLRATWDTPWDDISVSATWRYIASVTAFDYSNTALDYQLGSQNYMDLGASFPLPSNTMLHIGINNVLDNNPPITTLSGTLGNGNTYPQVYDSMGRYLFADITINM